MMHMQNILPNADELLEQIYPVVKSYSGVTFERHQATVAAVLHVVAHTIRGDFVECGVFRGASVMAMSLALNDLSDVSRSIYLYDTFEGMPLTTIEDGEKAKGYVEEYRRGGNHGCQCDESQVRRNVFSTGYPNEKFIFMPGDVEDTIPNPMHKEIAILRLDTDWYASTCHELKHLFPLLVVGGVLLLDDYFLWPGQKKATDEYFEKHNISLDRLVQTGGGAYFIK